MQSMQFYNCLFRETSSVTSADPLKVRALINTTIQGYNQSCHAGQSDLPRVDEDPIEPSEMLISLDPINVYDIHIDEAGTVATVL